MQYYIVAAKVKSIMAEKNISIEELKNRLSYIKSDELLTFVNDGGPTRDTTLVGNFAEALDCMVYEFTKRKHEQYDDSENDRDHLKQMALPLDYDESNFYDLSYQS